MEETTQFEYSISPVRYSTSPLFAKVSCIEVCSNKIICLSNNQTFPLPLYDKTISQPASFTSLTKPNDGVSRPTTRSMTSNTPLDFASLSQILLSFGVGLYSTILRDIEEVVASSSSRGKGVVEVNIWKVTNTVYTINDVVEKAAVETLLATQSIQLFPYNSETVEEEKNECAICIEEFTNGSLMAKLACGHDHHGVCINEWMHVKGNCPSCRSSISQ